MKQMKDAFDMNQDIPKAVVTKGGVHLKLVGKGSLEIKEDVENVIGEFRFYKVTGSQIIEGLNGSSPYMNYYLSEEDLNTVERYYKDELMAESA